MEVHCFSATQRLKYRLFDGQAPSILRALPRLITAPPRWLMRFVLQKFKDAGMSALDRYVVPDPNVIGRVIDDEAVLVLPEQGKIEVLNEVGARIWSLADGTRTVREIAAAICAEYDVDPAQAGVDTLAFVMGLVERGIVALEEKPARC